MPRASGLSPLRSPSTDATWERIRAAAIELVSERGYQATTVAALVERAGVTQADFACRFADKEDCCVQVYEANLAELDGSLLEAYERHEGWRDGLRAAAYALESYLSEHPQTARFDLLQLRHGGDRVLLARDRYMQRLVALVDAGRAEPEAPASLTRAVAESVLGATYHFIALELTKGSAERAQDRSVPELMFFAVRPYLGHEAALEELEMPPPLPTGALA